MAGLGAMLIGMIGGGIAWMCFIITTLIRPITIIIMCLLGGGANFPIKSPLGFVLLGIMIFTYELLVKKKIKK